LGVWAEAVPPGGTPPARSRLILNAVGQGQLAGLSPVEHRLRASVLRPVVLRPFVQPDDQHHAAEPQLEMACTSDTPAQAPAGEIHVFPGGRLRAHLADEGDAFRLDLFFNRQTGPHPDRIGLVVRVVRSEDGATSWEGIATLKHEGEGLFEGGLALPRDALAPGCEVQVLPPR
jgi:hypothetical protein